MSNALAYFYAYSVYTLDEKFKRNSSELAVLRPAPSHPASLSMLKLTISTAPGRVLLALGGDSTLLSALQHLSELFPQTADVSCSLSLSLARARATGVYICKNTPHGNSLIALFAAFNLATGLALGLLIGFGDGNVVDLEAAEAERLRRVKGDAVKAKSH